MPLDSAALAVVEQGRPLTREQRWQLACGLLGFHPGPSGEPSWHFRNHEATFLAEILAFWPTGEAFFTTLRAFVLVPPSEVLTVLDQLVTEQGRARYMLDEARALGPKNMNHLAILGAQARVMAFYSDWAGDPKFTSSEKGLGE